MNGLVPMSVVFGAITKSLAEQLRDQGLTVSDEAELGRIQLIADAVSTVAVHRLMTPSQSDKARTKLAKRLWKIVRAELDAAPDAHTAQSNGEAKRSEP